MFKWKDNRKFSKKDFVRLFLNRGSGVKGSKFMRLSQLDQKLHFVVACQAREYFTKYIIVTKDSFCETAFLLCGHTCQELDIGPSIPSQCWNQLSAVPPLSFNMLLQFIILSRKNHMNAFVKTNAFSFIGWEEIYSEKRKSIWSLNKISFPATFDFAALSAVFDDSGVMSIINICLIPKLFKNISNFQNYLIRW